MAACQCFPRRIFNISLAGSGLGLCTRRYRLSAECYNKHIFHLFKPKLHLAIWTIYHDCDGKPTFSGDPLGTRVSSQWGREAREPGQRGDRRFSLTFKADTTTHRLEVTSVRSGTGGLIGPAGGSPALLCCEARLRNISITNLLVSGLHQQDKFYIDVF